MPLPLIQYWHSQNPPGYIADLLTGFRTHNPDRPQLVFNERTAERFIVERFGERHANAFRACAVPAMQADYFRYCAVHALGGIYVDVDFVCQRPLDPLLEADGQLFAQTNGYIYNGFFAFGTRGHPFLETALEIATSNVERRISESIALTTGQAIFSVLVQLNQGASLAVIRESVPPNWRAIVEQCWGDFSEAVARALDAQPAISDPFAGIHISTNAEMQTWVKWPESELPYRLGDLHWANWRKQGRTIFRNL